MRGGGMGGNQFASNNLDNSWYNSVAPKYSLNGMVGCFKIFWTDCYVDFLIFYLRLSVSFRKLYHIPVISRNISLIWTYTGSNRAHYLGVAQQEEESCSPLTLSLALWAYDRVLHPHCCVLPIGFEMKGSWDWRRHGLEPELWNLDISGCIARVPFIRNRYNFHLYITTIWQQHIFFYLQK